MIKKVFIANRGEIACRVIQTCKAMGIETVSLHTEPEKNYAQVFLADHSIFLEGETLAENYLNQDLLIKLIQEHKCDAVHPGYGLLSENAEFRKKLEKTGVQFLGPSSEAMNLMGDKIQSKRAVEKLGLPLLPGYHGDNQDATFLLSEAKKIGLPVLIKASAGGGGKGMRVVRDWGDFEEGLTSAKSEALRSFGDDKVLLEKWIDRPRHLEVQVLSDRKGNHIHLWERECSLQRRHQKVIEEAPSPSISQKVRVNLCETARKIAAGIDYESAGTVEFIVDENDNFYFLEMNTRLQVEHPVTELITGLDIVAWQIRIANNETLPAQEHIRSHGHALEARLYAETPENNFLPSIGVIEKMGSSNAPGIRVDTGVQSGDEITSRFDPMIAKVCAYGMDREASRARLLNALDDVFVTGVSTNGPFMQWLLTKKEFVNGRYHTGAIAEWMDEYLESRKLDLEEQAAAIAAQAYVDKFGKGKSTRSSQSAESEFKGWMDIPGVSLGPQ